MKKLVFVLWVIAAFMLACNTEKKETGKKYSDLFGFNMKGDVKTVQDSIFVIDSNGKQHLDSAYYGMGEYKDGLLINWTDIDTLGKKAYSTYLHFDNGLFKSIETVINGKKTYKLDIQVDSANNYLTAQSYDSTGKMDYYNTDLKMNEFGMVTAGKLYKADSSFVNAFASEYDSNRITNSTTYDSSGKVKSKTTFKSNEQGDVIEETRVSIEKDSSTTKITTYTYTYDDEGNWTLQTKINEKGKPMKITKRVITYGKKE